MTPIMKVITEYCDKYINDIRFKKLAKDNASLYSWRTWAYLRPAISLFDNPSTMYDYLTKDMIEPKFDSYIYQIETAGTQTITLGEEYKGYELFDAIQVDEDGEYYVMENCTYDSENATITITNAVEGDIYQFDFYKDGYFAKDLTGEQMNILGICFSLIWELRFSNDFIAMTPKLEDKTFAEQNRAHKILADNARIKEIKTFLNETMNKYAQNIVIRKIRN